MKRWWHRPLGAIVGAALLAGCVPSSPDADTYDDKAMRTLGAAVSETRTVAMLMQTSYDGRMLRPAALAQLRYSEDSLDTATSAFTELNPPPTRDTLYARTSTLLGAAGDLVTEARIATERSQDAHYPQLARQLRRLAERLERLEERTR